MKKIIVLLLAFTLASPPLVSGNNLKDIGDNLPEWAKRVTYNIQLESDSPAIYYFETIQPLRQNGDKTVTYFVQPRVSFKNEDATYNLGFGYRKIYSNNWLLGANVFGDYQDDHEHGRVGVGAELLGQKLEARANGYVGVTTARVVEERDGLNTTYEQVVDGVDFELGTPIPYLPWLKLYGSGFFWNHKHSNDRYGWKTRMQADINKWSIFEIYVWNDNKGEHEIGGKLEVSVPFDTFGDILHAFRLNDTAYKEKDLKEYNLIPVERNYDIVVEKWSETPNGTVSIQVGRGN